MTEGQPGKQYTLIVANMSFNYNKLREPLPEKNNSSLTSCLCDY